MIRQMTDGQLVDLLRWGSVVECGIEVPECDEGCELSEVLSPGCALKCGVRQKEKAIRKWIVQEVEE